MQQAFSHGYPVAINAHLLSLYSQFADTPQGPSVSTLQPNEHVSTLHFASNGDLKHDMIDMALIHND
jgi:hypothetical protein